MKNLWGIIMRDFIYELAQKFAPIYKASGGEECYLTELEHQEKPRILRAYPAWNPFVYFSALRLDTKEDLVAYKINYFTRLVDCLPMRGTQKELLF
jgi:hypothetical protein